MKHAKRIASLLLALVMVFALCATAFAAGETGTITVDNPQKDQTYTAYKIFGVTYDTKIVDEKTVTGDHYAYTIDSDAPNNWFAEVVEYLGSTWDATNSKYNVTPVAEVNGVYTGNGITLTRSASDPTVYVVEIQEEGAGKFSAPDFARFLRTKEEGKKGEDLTVADGKATITGLELGYYFVTSSTGALCNLTTTNPTANIHDKNEVVFEKMDDKQSVEVGDIVNYVITGKVPDTTGFDSYKYQITDKMSTGLTFNDDVKVYINGTEITENFTIKTGAEAGEKDFVLDIDVMNLTFGAKIEVKYTATVNENAAGKIENNHATLEYSNDPTDSTKTTTLEDEETVYSAKIVIDKYASKPLKADGTEDTSEKLAGATFVLYRYALHDTTNDTYSFVKDTATGAVYTADDAATENVVKLYYAYNENKVAWNAVKDDATSKTTDNNGAAEFIGLEDGTYYLEETVAPAGYNLLKTPSEIKIDGTSATAENLAPLTHPEGVANNTGSILPDTGGMGTTMFYVVGTILLVGAAVLLITKKRMIVAK